jgi:hypothetical protein
VDPFPSQCFCITTKKQQWDEIYRAQYPPIVHNAIPDATHSMPSTEFDFSAYVDWSHAANTGDNYPSAPETADEMRGFAFDEAISNEPVIAETPSAFDLTSTNILSCKQLIIPPVTGPDVMVLPESASHRRRAEASRLDEPSPINHWITSERLPTSSRLESSSQDLRWLSLLLWNEQCGDRNSRGLSPDPLHEAMIQIYSLQVLVSDGQGDALQDEEAVKRQYRVLRSLSGHLWKDHVERRLATHSAPDQTFKTLLEKCANDATVDERRPNHQSPHKAELDPSPLQIIGVTASPEMVRGA